MVTRRGLVWLSAWRLASLSLIALSISAATNPTAQVAMEKLAMLKNCQAHSTTILPTSDEQTFRKLGIDVTCDAEYASESLFYNN